MNDKLLIAARSDGIGCRLLAIIYGMYLSKKLSCKFGYVWEELNQLDDHFTSGMIENKKLKFRDIDKECDIFDINFITEYSYTGKYSTKAGDNLAIANHILKKNTLNESIFYANHREVGSKLLKDKDAYSSYQNIWNNIKFADNIKKLFLDADYLVKKYSPFIALHIRSGDTLYNHENWDVGDCYKATNLEISCEIIEDKISEGYNIILFSDSNHIADYLANKYSNKVISFDHLKSKYDFRSSTQEALFDMHAMSCADIIYGPDSNFSLLSSCIGNKKFINIYTLYPSEDIYYIIKKRIDNDYIDNTYKAFSYYLMYRIGKRIGINCRCLIPVLNNAIKYNNLNAVYYLALIGILLEVKEYNKAEKIYIQNIYKIGRVNIVNVMKNYNSRKQIGEVFLSNLLMIGRDLKNLTLLIGQEFKKNKYFKSTDNVVAIDPRTQLGKLIFDNKNIWIFKIRFLLNKIKYFYDISQEVLNIYPHLDVDLNKSNICNQINNNDLLNFKIGETILKFKDNLKWRWGGVIIVFKIYKIINSNKIITKKMNDLDNL